MFGLRGNGCCGAEWLTRAVGQELPVAVSVYRPFERLVLSETCRTAYAYNSALAAIGVQFHEWPVLHNVQTWGKA